MARRAKLRDTNPDAPATAWTVRTPETLAVILEALENGATRRAACAVAGIDQGTLIDWAKDDANVSSRLICAEDKCEAEMSRLLKTAAVTDWRAAESWLKRRRREDYGDNNVTMLKGYTDEQLLAIATGSIGGAGAPETQGIVEGEGKATITVVYADDTTTTAPRSTAGN